MHNIRLTVFCLAISLALVTSVQCARPIAAEVNSRTIPAARNQPASDPELTSTELLSSADLSRIGRNLGVALSDGANTFYKLGDTEVQVNYLVPENESELNNLFKALFAASGSTNAVLLGNDRVFEMISKDPWAAEMVKGDLDLAPLQWVKLTPFTVYGEAKLVSDEVVVGSELERIAGRLNVSLSALINQAVQFGGQTVKVNFMAPGDGIDAGQILDALRQAKGSREGLFNRAGAVVEVVGNSDAAHAIERCLTVAPPSPSRPANFQVTFDAIPVAHEDYMKQNELSAEAETGATDRDLKRIDPSLDFGNSLPFFTNGGASKIDFGGGLDKIDDSLATGWVESEAAGEMVTAHVTLTVETGRPLTVGPNDTAPYLEPTGFWPSDSNKVRGIVSDVITDHMTDREKATALRGWVRNNIEYGGEIVGSRYGVEKVLEQGHGRCWDLSDVFITLARAAGLPSRQIGGWLYGSEGHIWSQVWLSDEGVWLDIDATSDDIAVSSFYIPIWGTRNGDMMFIYTKTPVIERQER